MPLYAQPLNKSAREIRLLHLRPGLTFADDLVCKIEYASLDAKPVYFALSYVWAGAVRDPKVLETRAIVRIVNASRLVGEATGLNIADGTIEISANLNAALRYLRPVGTTATKNDLVIWIDQISINQNDNTEKSWQVAQMQHVYAQAARVVVWLGPPADGSDLAMETLLAGYRFSARTSAYLQKGTRTVDMTKIPPPQSLQEMVDIAVSASLGRLFGREIESDVETKLYPIDEVAKLLTREWWGRLWVLQEFAMANEVQFVCGKHRIENDKIILCFLDGWDTLVAELGNQPKRLDHRPWTMFLTRLKKTGSRVLPDVQLRLKSLLQESNSASLEATDPHDHIYALLGMATDRDQLGIEIDYNIPYQEIYIKLAKAYMKRGDFWFLPYCQNNPDTRNLLPSWVPNWSDSLQIRPLEQVQEEFKISSRPRIRFGIVDTVSYRSRICWPGFFVDTITWTSSRRPPSSSYTYMGDVTPQILHWLRMTSYSLIGCEALEARDFDIPTLAACHAFLGNKLPLPKEDCGMSMEAQKAAVEETFKSLLVPPIFSSSIRSEGENSKRRKDAFCGRMMEVTMGRLMFHTVTGFIGVGPRYMTPGDKIIVFQGAGIPLAVRDLGKSTYMIIGEVFGPDLIVEDLLRTEKPMIPVWVE